MRNSLRFLLYHPSSLPIFVTMSSLAPLQGSVYTTHIFSELDDPERQAIVMEFLRRDPDLAELSRAKFWKTWLQDISILKWSMLDGIEKIFLRERADGSICYHFYRACPLPDSCFGLSEYCSS